MGRENGNSSTSHAAIATVDLATVSAKSFAEVVHRFDIEAKALRAAGKLPDFPATTGKMKFTPEDAKRALFRNGGNREIRLGHVQAIATMMQMGAWRLAQPILFDEAGDLQDGQHRLYAIWFGGITIESMVMVVPTQPDLFAVIDAGQGRSAKDALFTAGFTGAPGPLAGGAKLVYRYEHGQLGPIQQPKTRKLHNLEMVAYVRAHPELVSAADEVIDNYPIPVSIIADKGVAIAFAYLVNQTFEDGVLHDYLMKLAGASDLNDDNPIKALRHRFDESGVSEDRLSGPQKLALLIKSFLMEDAGEKVYKKDIAKGLTMRHTDKYPRIEDALKDSKVA
jgi:hypothetical protein